MQYNLTHRGAVLATFDTNDMDPDEAQELKRINGQFFAVERAVPDRIVEMPEGYSNLAGIKGWEYQPGTTYPASSR